MMPSRRIVVFAFSDVGHACVKFLLDRGEDVVFCYTYADEQDSSGWPPSVSRLCLERGVPFAGGVDWKNPAAIENARAQKPDLILSFYYRELLPREVLGAAPLGAYNVHGSLLPKYRGRAPVNWAVLEGETETGATLHAMAEKADAGDIVDQERVEIGPDETAFEVQQKVVDASTRVLARQIDALKNGTAPRRAQNLAEGSYRGRRSPEDGAIDWTKSSTALHNLVRAVSHPYPGAFTDTFGEKTILWKTRLPGFLAHDAFPGEVYADDGRLFVNCGDDRHLEILRLQTAGEPEMSASEWLATRPLYPPGGKAKGR